MTEVSVDVAAELANLTGAARKFTEAVIYRSNAGERLARMAQVFRCKGSKADAVRLARVARLLAPGDQRVRLLTDWLIRKEAPLWHFLLVHDDRRNVAYAKALDHYIEPGMTVFEIGTGTGLLAMLAVRAGAAHVYTCENRREVARAAREIIENNGMGGQITVIAKDAYALRVGVDLPERCDVFVAEVVDNSLLGEGVLPLTEFARKHLLKPGAVLLPSVVSAVGYLVPGDIHRQYYSVGDVLGFDLSAFNRFAPLEINASVLLGSVLPLSEAMTLASFDLAADEHTESASVDFTATRDGIVDGLMRWLRLDFGNGIVFENAPPVRSCWDPHLHVLDTPRAVLVGERVTFNISHDRNSLYVEEHR